MEDAPVLDHFLPEPLRVSRRHLLKAIGIATGALGVSLSKDASAYDCTKHNDCCFLRGTLIRGVNGYRPIENLAVGDLLPAQFSGMAAIRKIISFAVRHDETGRWPDECKLVRICAGALDEGVPVRDLFVTHTHEVFLNQVLVPIVSLVNGKTISFHDEIGLNSVEYFHLEFDSHDVIDAEGALCESFRDGATERCAPLALNGGRSQFWSHLRNAAAPFVDRRQPFDLIRDSLDIRAGL
jgi:hypothetical protein